MFRLLLVAGLILTSLSNAHADSLHAVDQNGNKVNIWINNNRAWANPTYRKPWVPYQMPQANAYAPIYSKDHASLSSVPNSIKNTTSTVTEDRIH